jgi:hypothetical protein
VSVDGDFFFFFYTCIGKEKYYYYIYTLLLFIEKKGLFSLDGDIVRQIHFQVPGYYTTSASRNICVLFFLADCFSSHSIWESYRVFSTRTPSLRNGAAKYLEEVIFGQPPLTNSQFLPLVSLATAETGDARSPYRSRPGILKGGDRPRTPKGTSKRLPTTGYFVVSIPPYLFFCTVANLILSNGKP